MVATPARSFAVGSRWDVFSDLKKSGAPAPGANMDGSTKKVPEGHPAYRNPSLGYDNLQKIKKGETGKAPNSEPELVAGGGQKDPEMLRGDTFYKEDYEKLGTSTQVDDQFGKSQSSTLGGGNEDKVLGNKNESKFDEVPGKGKLDKPEHQGLGNAIDKNQLWE